MRLLVLAALSLLLAACARGEPETPGVLSATGRLVPPAGEALEISIDGLSPSQRVDQVVLIDPQGVRTPAQELVPIRRDSGLSASRPTIGIGVSGGSSSGINPAVGIGWGIFGGGGGPGERGRRVVANIPIADAAAWREQPSGWRVEVVFDDVTGERRGLVLPLARR